MVMATSALTPQPSKGVARPHVIDSSTFRSLGRATPFDGWGVSADVAMTICSGEIVYGDLRNEEADV